MKLNFLYIEKKITEKVHSESKIYSILTYEGFEVPSMVEKNGKKNLYNTTIKSFV